MEAAIASGILKSAGHKLFSLLASEFAAIVGVKKSLKKLQSIHKELEELLSTVRDLSIENDPGFGWVFQLKDLAFDVEDLLYEVHLKAEKYKIASCSGKHATTDILSAKPKSFPYRWKVARKTKSIRKKLAAIAKQRSDMNAIGQNIPRSQPMLSRNRANEELSLLTNVEESEIPTRDQEKVSLISKLLKPNDGEHGWIVSIVGLGGSGKTTLAKHICHDKKIKEQFKDKIYWVHVSQEFFNEEILIRKVFEAITKEKSDLHTLQHIVDEISKKLTSEKFLLVFDDAWHDGDADWKRFMVHVKGHAPGSKLLLTTRDQKVAEAVKCEHIFNLASLSEVESWSLFLKNSEWKEEYLGSEFIQFGRQIVNKCGGVPLAIKTLGGILSGNRELSTWRAISQSDLWIEEDIEARVFASLKLSYIHLNDHVKECFVFFSIFPKGHRIKRNYIIEQWIANGFIKPMRDEQPEIIGNQYFELLVKVGFIEEIHEVAYKMHDLIHDLTRYIVQSGVGTSPPKNIIEGSTQKCRYLSLTSCNKKVERVRFDKVRALCALEANPSLDELVKKNPYICSVVLKCAVGTPFPLFILKLDYLGYLEIYNVFCTKLPDSISGCWNLQSLHFIHCSGFAALPESFGKLKKLRILEFIWTYQLESLPQSIGDCPDLQSLHIQYCEEFREIPNTIGKNQNLRVLEIVGCFNFKELPSEVTLISGLECINLNGCGRLVELPRGIGNLKGLEFLKLNYCWNLNRMPSEIVQLTRLKRLELFVVGRGADDAKISDLENLNMIGGELELNNLPHLMDSSDAAKAVLNKKKNIQKLMLRWSESATEEELVSNLCGLDALEPPAQIKQLEIEGYRGFHLPHWMSTQSESCNPESALLKETSRPQFLCLVRLKLWNMPNLKHMRGILVLPSLKNLQLVDMSNLEEFWTTTTSGLGIGAEKVTEQQCFLKLSHLTVHKCPKLIVEPYFPPSLECLDIKLCKSELVSRGRSSFPLLAHTSHHPEADGASICNGAFVTAPRLNTLVLSEMVMPVSDWGFLQHLTKLESLILDDFCEGLTELPDSIRVLTSLKRFEIRDCFNLMALPEWLGELRSLQHITISRCPMMDNLPQSIKYLTSLTSLGISHCVNLKQIPDEIQHLTSLEYLSLVSCKALTDLPDGMVKLSALHSLYIKQCPALRSLPSSIQHLTSLQRLIISGCPELARRYKKEVGGDWHLLSHIPVVKIWW